MICIIAFGAVQDWRNKNDSCIVGNSISITFD